MKNSKTTIKELTRQYRSVLKKCLFLNAIALGLLIAPGAKAAESYAYKDLSNITDAGKTIIVNAVRADAGYVDPDAKNTIYSFKDASGNSANMATEGADAFDTYKATYSEASGASGDITFKKGTATQLSYDMVAGTVDGGVSGQGVITAADYSFTYYDKDDKAVSSTLAGNTAKSAFALTDTMTGLTKDIGNAAGIKFTTNATTDKVEYDLNIEDYTTESNGATFSIKLDQPATETTKATYKLFKGTSEVTEPADITAYQGFKDALVTAYEKDKAAADAQLSTMNTAYGKSLANYNAINDSTTGLVVKDQEKVDALNTKEGGYYTAYTNYNKAVTDYTGSLGQKIDQHIGNAITADNGIIKTAAEQFIATTAANVEKDQLGWDITASPADEGSFAKSLTGGIYADLIAGEDRTVVGALNKIGEFIGTERTDDADPTGLYAVLENKEANISAQLGYNVANNPTNKKAENSLINKLNSDLVEELDTNVSVVDAINQAYTDAISRTVTLKEDGAIAEISDGTTTATLYTKQAADAKFAQYSDWAQNVLGIDEATMAKGAANQVQTVLTQLAADDGTINNIEASSIIGAIHELDQEKAKLIGNNTFEGTNEFRQGIIISDFSTLDNKTVGLTASDVGLKLSSGLEATEAVLSDSLTLAGTKVTGISSDEITDDGSDSTLATTKAVAATVAVEAELRKNGDAEIKGMIGDGFDSTNTVAKSITDLNNALVSGDSATYTRAVADANNYTDVRFNQLDHKIDKLEDRMEKGLAANAALAGLTPLPSSEHKTQISAAMGGYGSNQALAIGGYHYINDRTLLNAGAAYGGNSDISYKVGVTFGF